MQLNTLGLTHDFLRRYVKKGMRCIDATAGKGRDTALLCELVGQEGSVIAFDVQAEAIAQTEAFLASKNYQAQLILDSHANMKRYAVEQSVDCIVFNFGRLPGGNPLIFTNADSSICAIEAGLQLLKAGGIMSLSIYYGGENGFEERDAILAYIETLDSRQYSALTCNWSNRRGNPPISVMIWKDL